MRPPVVSRVTACVASVGRLSPHRVRPDADLITDTGLDSVQLFQVWAALEEEMGLTAGLLGAAGPTTPAAIAGELERLGARVPSPPLDRSAIMALIPHRPPILMLDRITALRPGERGTGEMRLDASDTWFAGHFPGRSVLPGIVVVEACAQLVAVVQHAGADPAGDGGRAAAEYLASIERFKFPGSARPGDVLTLEAVIGRRSGRLQQARVRAAAADRTVGEGLLTVTMGAAAPSAVLPTTGSE